MAELQRVHLTISKGMKLYCTVEQASEDVIVVSLKHKAKEYRGILLDSSERHLPPGLCFNTDNAASKSEGENADNSGADGPDSNQPKEARGVTLDCRYSYNNDPAKYNEQPLPTASAISIRPARGKQVRNIRLRPRQTLCSKCKAAIHDTKSKSPNKIPKPDGQEQETHPHNTRYRAALSSKPDTPNTPPGPTLRSGSRNRRADSTPKVILENIRPKREVKPTAKKREADAAQKSRLTDASTKKNNVLDERTGDSAGLGASKDVNKTTESLINDKKGEDSSRVMLERSVSLDNPTALGQYNKQPVVRLDKTAVNNMNFRTEVKEEKQEKAPTISIVNIRSTPAIKITYGAGAGDRDVLKIPPRLPGGELKSPDDHSTADESPAPVSPLPPPSPPQKKAKKASRRTRDKQKQRYRIINDGDAASEIHAPGIKIAGYHKKHKRKHKHRHASSEDENFNSEVDVPPPAKLPAIITKLSVVPSVNDLNGNEKKSDPEVLRDSSNETPTRQDELADSAIKSPNDMNESVSQVRRDESSMEFVFDDDPLNLKNEEADLATCDTKSDPQCPKQVSQREDLLEQAETTASESLLKLDDGPFQMWGSPVQTPAFEAEGSPTQIEAPPFQSDDSQDGLIVGPLRMGSSPVKDENMSSFDSVPMTPTHATSGTKDEVEPSQEEEKKEAVPYGVGMFEDLTPDEDEDDHNDNNVSQPMYQLPKKPRIPMYPGWSNDGLAASPHVPGYLSKKSSDDPSALYSSQTGVYQNGPSSFFSSGAGSSSMYTGAPTANFPSSPAPRIQNSPTPIIQKSPMPIFNYNASRYQSSPNRRFGSSPSRRYHSIGESGPPRQQSVIAGNLSHSRFQGHDADRFQAQRESISSSSSGYRGQSHSESDVSSSANRYPSKFDSQTTFRYQSSNEKGGGSRYPSQTESIAVSRLSSIEENSSVSKSQGAADSSSALRYVWSSGDSGSLPRFAIPSNGNSSVPQYTSQGGTSSLPRYSAHPVEGSLPNQYPSLGSTETRFQPHTESRYKAHSSASIPSPLSLQKNSRSVSSLGSNSVYADEKERKSVLSAPHYETVDTSALFMTHSIVPPPVTSDENISVPRFLSKPHSSAAAQNTVARMPGAEPAKAIGVFADSPESNAPVPLYHQNSKHLSGTGSGTQGPGVLMPVQEQSGGSISRHPSSSSLSQSNISVSISDSEDDSDSAVPGFVPTSGVLNSSAFLQDIGHVPMMKIQTQNMNSCLTEDGREIRVGDVQWGKVQGFPWWPCRVVLIKLTHRDHREQTSLVTQVCHVAWFGSRTVSDLHPSELRPFREEFSKRHVKKKRGPYHTAVQQALVATDTALPSADVSHAPAQQVISHTLMHDLVS